VALPSVRAVPIRIRLALAYALFLVLTFAVAGAFVLTSLQNGMEQQVDQSLRLRAARVQNQLTLGPDGRPVPQDAARVLATMGQEEDLNAPVIWVQVLDARGIPLASAPDVPPAQLPPSHDLIVGALSGQEGAANVRVAGDRIRVLAQPIVAGGQVGGVVLVAESLRLLDATFQQVAALLAIAAVSAALLALAGGWWLIGRALGPVAAVTRTARTIATTGHFEQRISPPPARDELRDLVATFNDMLGRLARTVHRQREFLGNASHELRGPLTVIQGNLDLLRLDLPEEERQLSVDAAAGEVDRMRRLVGDLLFLAEVDSERTVRHEAVALDAVVAETFERARLVDDGAHALTLARNDPTMVRGDRDRLAQVVANLLQNALRYTPVGGAVTLCLQNHGPVAELSVADSGIGIAAEHLPHIFERFYRVDRARSRVAGSTGLGLPIVKEVVEAHGGQVRIRSEPGQGSTFSVVLPTADPLA
jgi:heavy metal sensor kinase